MTSTRPRRHPISRSVVAALTTAATVLLAHPAAQAASAPPVEPRGCSFPASDNVKVVVVPEGLTLPNIGNTGPIAVFITETNQHAYVTLGATKPIRTVDRGAVDAIDSAFTRKITQISARYTQQVVFDQCAAALIPAITPERIRTTAAAPSP